MASKSLGPFPKTLRWREIVGEAAADCVLTRAKSTLELWAADPRALQAVISWVSLPIATRCPSPSTTPRQYDPKPHPAARAAEKTIAQWLAKANEATLFPADECKVWRDCDGPAFCDLARLYFENLLAECLLECLGEVKAQTSQVLRFAHEASIITLSFSARWFNACARYETPDSGSIRWYLGHCLGKLDLELSREMSDWVEPTGNPWKRRRNTEPALHLE